jgi:hypothetical protein
MDINACNFNPFANIPADMDCIYLCAEAYNAFGQYTDKVKSNTDLEVSVFPNPFRDAFSFQINTPASQRISFTISDAFGRLIYNRDPFVFHKGQVEMIDLSDYPRGIYLLRLYNGNNFIVKNLIKN